MALRTQEAYRQMQERQLVAQAEMLNEHAMLYKQQREDEINQQAVQQAAADQFDYLYNDVGMDKDEAQQTAILAASLVHPVAGEKMARAYHALKGTTTAANVPANIAAAREVGTIKTKLDAAKQRLNAAGVGVRSMEAQAPLRAEVENLQAQYDYLQGANEARIANLEAKTKQVTEGIKPQVTTLPDGSVVLYNPATGRYDKPEKVTRQEFVNKHLSGMLKEEVGDATAALQKLNALYDQIYGTSQPKTNQFRLGEVRRTPAGKKIAYQGGDPYDQQNWKEIK